MAGAYAKEFEKWLQVNKPGTDTEENDSVDMEYSGDEVDNDEMKSKDNNQRQIPMFKSNSNDTFNRSRQNFFLDEPPILEPVLCSLGSKVLNTKKEWHRDDDIQNEESNGVNMQFNSESDKVEFLYEKGSTFPPPEKTSFNKMKDSENIFDKFGVLSEGDDFPPPLIPSHEAHLTTVDAKDEDSITEKSYTTLQNLSPNFCAMEADSTSEVLRVDPQNTLGTSKDRISKSMFGNEIAVECDSTCMLGSSPNVVSPDSVSNMDSDNLVQTPTQDESVFLQGTHTLSWNTLQTQNRFNVLPSFSEQADNQQSDFTSYIENRLILDSDLLDPGWDRECPKLEAVMDVKEGKDVYQSKRSNDVDDPPILSVIPQSLKSPSVSVRRKRHTIDTIHSVKKHKQKSYHRDSLSKRSKHTDAAEQLSASHITATFGEFSSKSGAQCSSSVKMKDNSTHPHSSHQFHPRKHRRQRCQTLPIVDLISYGSHLPRELSCFVVDSSRLSDLQNRMHQLLYLLFPQLSEELSAMSPESSRFESLLNDLFLSLQDCDDGSSGKAYAKGSASCVNKVRDSEKDTKHDVSAVPSNISALSSPSGTSDLTCSTLDSHSQSCVNEAENSDSYRQSEFDVNPHQHSTIKCHHNNPGNKNSASTAETVLPGFSKLNVGSKLKVLQVVVHKNPSAVYKNLVRMCCAILQHLLPDLDVSLWQEFIDSPHDLLSFIDSVIASN